MEPQQQPWQGSSCAATKMLQCKCLASSCCQESAAPSGHQVGPQSHSSGHSVLGSIVGMPEASQQQRQPDECTGSIGARLDGQRECDYVQAATNVQPWNQHARQPTHKAANTQQMLHAGQAQHQLCGTQVPTAPQCSQCLSSRSQHTYSRHSCVGVHVSACLHAIASRLGAAVWVHVSSCLRTARHMTPRQLCQALMHNYADRYQAQRLPVPQQQQHVAPTGSLLSEAQHTPDSLYRGGQQQTQRSRCLAGPHTHAAVPVLSTVLKTRSATNSPAEFHLIATS